MNRRHLRIVPLALVVAALLVGLTPGAAAYTRSTNKPPTPADLLLNSGDSKTLTVVVLNLTPFTMYQANRTTLANETNTDRSTKKSFMFAPVGVPGGSASSPLPGLAGEWTPEKADSPCMVFTPSKPNSTLHPYTMVFSFDERGGTVKEGYYSLRLADVWQDSCHEASKNYVDIGFFFSRIDPDKGLKSEVFREISACVTFLVDTIGLIVEPENPLAWYDFYVATKELASKSFELQNAVDDGTTQAYFAAYPWPDAGSPADQSSSLPSVVTYCDSCSTGESSDGVDAEWGNGIGGPYAGNIVVTTHLLRGNDDTTPQTGTIAFVTLWTWDMYYTAWGATHATAMERNPLTAKIHGMLAKKDPKKVFGYAHLLASLTPAERAVYGQVIRALQTHRSLTEPEKELMAKLAVAFEKGKTSLEGGAHERANQRHPEGGNVPRKP